MNKAENKNFSPLLDAIVITLPIALLFSVLIAEILIFIIIFYFFVNVNKKEIKFIISNKIFLGLFILSFFIIINYFINFSKEPSISRSFFFIRFPLYVISVSYLLNKNFIDIKKIFLIWTFILIIVCLDLQLQNFTGKNILGYEAILQGSMYRLGGFLDDELKIANLVNNFFVISLGALLFYNKLILNKTYTIVVIFALSILVIHSVYLTAERANFISLILFVISIFLVSNIKKFILSILVLLYLLVLVNYTELSSNIKFKRMMTLKTYIVNNTLAIKSKNDFLHRNNNIYFSHYSTAFQIFSDYPLMGVGLKNFRKYCHDIKYDKKIYPQLRNRNCTTHPHNLFFEIISELGGIGAIIFFSFFSYFFFVSLKNYLLNKNIFLFGNTIFLMTSFIPLLPGGSFFTNWNAIMFWTIFAINCHLIKKYK
jgi:O-antigen ligase|tara:strand:- start:8031 stop:9311 length:1281 start_codon:yes stop_codon:yes gene_type:complete